MSDDGIRAGPELGEQAAQRQHVDGGLDHGRRHLVAVGLAVDDRERLDLDHMELPVQLERDQVRLQVHRPAAYLELQQRVVEQRPGVRSRRGRPRQQRPGPARA